jgi:hypothetical protein
LQPKKGTRGVFYINIKNEGKCWPEFYKYVKRRKGSKENIPAIKDCNGRPIIDPIEKANSLFTTMLRYSAARVKFNIYNVPTQANPSLLIRKSLGKGKQRSEKNKSIGPDGISVEILKLGGEAMIPYLTRLLDITMNNGTLPADWKRAIVFPIHKGVIDH